MAENDTEPETAENSDPPERPQIDPEKERELIEKTKQAREEHAKQHNEMLEAVAEGEDWNVEDYEWVSLGGVELKVKTWMPGDVEEDLGTLMEMADNEEAAALANSGRVTVEALTEQTEVVSGKEMTQETKSEVRQFWINYWQRWGSQGLEKAIEAVTEPIEDARETKQDAHQSFRADQKRPSNREPSDWRS